MQSNVPYGWEDTSNDFMMPQANEENVNTVYKSLPWQPRVNGSQEGINALEASLKRNNDMKKLTVEMLKEMEPGVFEHGETINSPEGVYMTDARKGDKLLWVAKRGGYHDWTIYCGWAESGYNWILQYGQKVINDENILKLVPCTDEALKLYRK